MLAPVHSLLQSYLGAASTARPGAQHMLNAEYFKRIDAMNFTLMHDDGQLPADLDEADVVLVGVSRTSKTPTAIYLANRGIKTANIPLVPGVPLPAVLETARKPLIVGLVASPERIVQIRQNRLLSLRADEDTAYVDRDAVAEEIAVSRRLCAAPQLADDRRDPALDRGDRGRDPRPLPRSPARSSSPSDGGIPSMGRSSLPVAADNNGSISEKPSPRKNYSSRLHVF